MTSACLFVRVFVFVSYFVLCCFVVPRVLRTCENVFLLSFDVGLVVCRCCLCCFMFRVVCLCVYVYVCVGFFVFAVFLLDRNNVLFDGGVFR